MATDTERTGGDTVQIPKRAFNFAVGLAAPLIIGISLVFWNLVLDSVRHDDRIAHLERFGPGSGDRNTKADGDRRDERLLELERWRQKHTEFGYEIVGRWERQHKETERRLDRMEKSSN